METLAKTALHEPVEIQVGGRSVVNKDITQLIEIRPEADRFLRLLEILGEFYENGKILIFVASQDLCDNLFRDLLKVGCPQSKYSHLFCPLPIQSSHLYVRADRRIWHSYNAK